MRTAVLVLLAATVFGCANRPKAPPPFIAPAARVKVWYFTGGPLSGPGQGAAVSEAPREALAVRIVALSLERAPTFPDLQPLGARATLVTVSRGGAAVVADPTLMKGAEICPPEAAASFIDRLARGRLGRTARISEVALALPPGITGELELADPIARQDSLSEKPTNPRLSLALFQQTGNANGNRTSSVQLALVAQQLGASVPPGGSSDAGESKAVPLAFQQETVLLDPLPTNNPTRFALVVPFRFAGHPSWGIVMLVDVSPGSDDPRYEQLVGRSVAQARSASAEYSGRHGPTTLPAARPSELSSAMALLSDQSRQRRALAFLADQTGARICQDAALSADANTLAAMCKRVSEAAGPATADARAMGWLLDRQTLALLSEAADAGNLPPEMVAVLTLHAGEAGRHPATIQDVLKSAGDENDLAVRLTAENLLFLEDSSPASRVRAFEWLSTRGRAPAAYDPLASARERRAAIDRSLSAATQPSGGGQ